MSTVYAICGVIVSLFKFTNADDAQYELEVTTLRWDSDMGNRTERDIDEIYVYVGAHTDNGELVNGATTDKVSADADYPNRNAINSKHSFNDTTNMTIASFFFTLWVKMTNGTEKVAGYSTGFYEIPGDVCTLDVNGQSYLRHGTWDSVGDLIWKLTQTGGSCSLIPTNTTTPEPTMDPALNETVEMCQLLVYDLGVCKPKPDSVSATREYFAYCEDKCGTDQILRTGPIAGYGTPKCGKEPLWPRGIYERTCTVPTCDFGMFKFGGDGVGAKSVALAVLVGITVMLNQ